MKLYNLSHPEQQVSFSEAVRLGLGKGRGLFFPCDIPKLKDINVVLAMPFIERSQYIIKQFLQGELDEAKVDAMVASAFNFDLPLVKVDNARYCLELFHGPTLAFKDFGARFMAQCINAVGDGKPLTILTATSGDTGAAVAHAFHGLDNIKVVVLFPQGKISVLQQKLFTTLGGNIHTLAIDGDFDACQELVKQAFDDEDIRHGLGLNSANSINISRLLAQVCYYFEAVAQFQVKHPNQAPIISVPSGNFGNLTAGMLAKAMGLPVARFIAATNANDTVPRYLGDGNWRPNKTIATLSNAMDVAEPSNWPRVEACCDVMGWPLSSLLSASVADKAASLELQALARGGYVTEPHAAIAAKALTDALAPQVDSEPKPLGIFLGTAHPAKFKEVVDSVLSCQLPLPQALAQVSDAPCLAEPMAADFSALKHYLFARIA
ncbi:MAG: threonine synthase [Shewanella sp.]